MLFQRGTTTVTWTVTDVHGRTNTCAQTVTVNDAEDPTITCPANVSVNTDEGECNATHLELGSPSTHDNCEVDGTDNDNPHTYSVGITTVTWTVTDIHGRTNTCAQLVTVTDNEAPGITCPESVTVNNDHGVCFAATVDIGEADVSDNCEVDDYGHNHSGNYNVGTTTLTWTVSDVH